MRLLLLTLVLAVCGAPVPAEAHDIGVSQAELIEREGHRYVLSVQAGPAIAYRFPAPPLPEHCGFSGNPHGVQGAGWRSFEFTCEGGLRAADRLDLPWLRDGVMMAAKWLDGSEAKALFRNEAGVIAAPLSELHAGSGSLVNAAKRYTALGVEHILLGIDHLLFVLGLLLIVQGPWMLVKTITAFTVAHSITLGLATLGFVTTPPRAVDAAIALSIVFLAVEILHARQGRFGLTYRHPWVVAFGFGLLHGLGFAGALTGIGLPQGEIPVALLFFNVGVEIGQLMFVCAFLLLRWSFRQLEFHWSRPAQSVPVYLIGTIATYWLIQRIGTIVFPV